MGQDLTTVARHLPCTDVTTQIHDLPSADRFDAARPASFETEAEVFRTPLTWRSDSTGSLAGTPVIVFDWDDTLMCSSAVCRLVRSPADLAELESTVESILRTSMALGETMIVTNGNATWVHDSATRFLPRLLPTLARLRVVSARALFEPSFPGDPYMWKQEAFRHLLIKERWGTRGAGLNLVALGDQLPEIEAAYDVVHILGASSIAKTVKFKEKPSVPELIGQLRRTELELSRLVGEETSGNRCLERREDSEDLSRAIGWRLTEKTPDARGLSPGAPQPPLSFKDLWPFFFS